MKKYEKICKTYDNAQTSKVQLKKDIETLTAKMADLRKEAEEIAASGDVDSYMRCKNDAARCEAEIEVARAVLAKMDNPVDLEDVKEAWAEYYEGASKDRAKELKELHKTEQQLLNQLRRISNMNLDIQNHLRKCCEIGRLEQSLGAYQYRGIMEYQPDGAKELAAVSELLAVLVANGAIKDFDAGANRPPVVFRKVNDGDAAGMNLDRITGF